MVGRFVWNIARAGSFMKYLYFSGCTLLSSFISFEICCILLRRRTSPPSTSTHHEFRWSRANELDIQWTDNPHGRYGVHVLPISSQHHSNLGPSGWMQSSPFAARSRNAMLTTFWNLDLPVRGKVQAVRKPTDTLRDRERSRISLADFLGFSRWPSYRRNHTLSLSP